MWTYLIYSVQNLDGFFYLNDEKLLAPNYNFEQ